MLTGGTEIDKQFVIQILVIIVGVISVIIFGLFLLAYVMGWGIFGKSKEIDVNINKVAATDSFYSDMTDNNNKDKLMKSYSIHDKLYSKLLTLRGQYDLMSYNGAPPDVVDALKEYMNSVKGYYYMPDTFNKISKLTNYLQYLNCSTTQGYTATSVDVLILQVLKSIQRDMDNFNNAFKMMTPNGSPLLSSMERETVFNNSLNGYLATDGSGLDPAIRKSLSSTLRFNDIDDEKSAANYTENVYHNSLNGSQIMNHYDKVNERENVKKQYSAAPDHKYIIEEPYMVSSFVGFSRPPRPCLGGVGPMTTQDAPNNSFMRDNAMGIGGLNSTGCSNGSCGAY